MLLRACGMPARYVVGYAAPASLFQGQADGSYQAVLEDDNAHAWAEVYREGIGWTVVEATPGFAALVTESDGASGQKEKEADSPDSPDTPGEAFDQEDTPEAETPGIGSRIFRVVKKALAAVALTIAACGIAAVIRRHILCKRRKRGGKGETPGEQIQRIYRSFAALQKFNKKRGRILHLSFICTKICTIIFFWPSLPHELSQALLRHEHIQPLSLCQLSHHQMVLQT